MHEDWYVMKNKLTATLRPYIDPVPAALAISFFAGGLLKFANAYLLGAAMVCGLIFAARKNGGLCLSADLPTAAICLVVLCYGISAARAADRGMALMGFGRMTTVLVFALAANNPAGQGCNRDHRWGIIPLVGAATAAAGALSALLSPAVGALPLFQNGRLGGPLAYANTYALWLLVGLVVLAWRPPAGPGGTAVAGLLVCGIVLTQSRGVIYLAVPALAFLFITRPAFRRCLCIAVPLGCLAGAALAHLAGGHLARLGVAPSQAGEWLTRLAYYHDAAGQIAKHPMGMGYFGYRYTQPVWQTAVYTTRYVHSSLLQYALDAGIPAAVGAAVAGAALVLGKKTPPMERLILILIFAHSIIDVDLEFLPMLFIICMCLRPKKGPRLAFGRPLVAALALAAAGFLFLGIVNLDAERGSGDLALAIFPHHTEALAARLGDPERQLQAARTLVSYTSHSGRAWDVLARDAAQKGNYRAATDYRLKSLGADRLSLSQYMSLLEVCAQGLEAEETRQNHNAARYYGEIIANVPVMMGRARASLGPYAYRLQHTPSLALPTGWVEYIATVQQKYGP